MQGHSRRAEHRCRNKIPDLQINISKLVELYVVRALATRFPISKCGVTINLLNPSLCYSKLTRNLDPALNIYLAVLRFLLARTAEAGSRMQLYASVAGEAPRKVLLGL